MAYDPSITYYPEDGSKRLRRRFFLRFDKRGALPHVSLRKASNDEERRLECISGIEVAVFSQRVLRDFPDLPKKIADALELKHKEEA